jgi:hypothetical protein
LVVVDDPEDEAIERNAEEPASDVERAREQEVPIGVPVSPEEFRRLKEEAAKPAPGDERACADEETEGGREEEDGNAQEAEGT